MDKWVIAYNRWLEDEGISKEDKDILKNYGDEDIKNNFYNELEFGTAGIRGIRGLGTARINKYLIRRVTQGYCDYLIEQVADARNKGVAIAYDSRIMSKEFALEASKVFSGNGIKVYLYDRIKSTPELSFTIRHLSAAGGLVLTASHNPPEYNGYKVYNEIGCQLSTEETLALTSKIDSIESFKDVKLDEKLENIIYLDDEIEKVYVDKILDLSLSPFNKDLKIGYSPLFGVGLAPIKRIFSKVGADYFLVEEQSIPDGNFPTAKKPNPEEKEALVRIIEEGKKHGGDILLATDPDADRLGVLALYNGEYEYISGNQIGGLLIDYILSKKDYVKEDSFVLTSVVTSYFGASVAKEYGVDTLITFTGFKNLGKKMEELLNDGKEVLFVYEESIGYLPEDFIRDKDGISAAYLVAEMAGELKRAGLTLVDKLKEIYGKIGFFKEKQISYVIPGIEGIEKIAGIMKDLRENGIGEVSKNLVLDEEIDYLNKSIDDENTNLLYYSFKDGSWVGVRPSGTEPKLKLYINVVDKEEEVADSKVATFESWFNKRIEKWL